MIEEEISVGDVPVVGHQEAEAIGDYSGKTIAVISDVHGNLQALTAVLTEINARGIETIWCLGDTTGYGAHPGECLDLVASRCAVALAGNHDLVVRGSNDIAVFNASPQAMAGAAFAMSALSEQHFSYLTSLEPSVILQPDLGAWHGSIYEPAWEYVSTAGIATGQLSAQPTTLGLVGHTHAQLLFELRPNALRALGGPVAPGTEARFEAGVKYVLNPGSVGQPRDRDPRAAWAEVSVGSGVTFHRTEYDIAGAQNAIIMAGLPGGSARRLAEGR